MELKAVENEHIGMFGVDFCPNIQKIGDGAEIESNLPMAIGERRH